MTKRNYSKLIQLSQAKLAKINALRRAVALINKTLVKSQKNGENVDIYVDFEKGRKKATKHKAEIKALDDRIFKEMVKLGYVDMTPKPKPEPKPEPEPPRRKTLTLPKKRSA